MRGIQSARRLRRANVIRPAHETRIVHKRPPIWLGKLVKEDEGGWRVRAGGEEWVLPLDPAVDPALIAEACAEGIRVLVDAEGAPAIVGIVQTSRALRIDRRGAVDAQVERFSIHARKEAVLKTFSSFIQLKGGEVELYGTRILSRAREAAKILARMIHLN